MQKEYKKHKQIMELLAVFHQQKFSKNLEYYKHFGDENIYEVEPEKSESSDHSQETPAIPTVTELVEQEKDNTEQDEYDSFTF